MHMCGVNKHKYLIANYITSGVLSRRSSQLTLVHFLTRYNEFKPHEQEMLNLFSYGLSTKGQGKYHKSRNFIVKIYTWQQYSTRFENTLLLHQIIAAIT